MQGKSDSPWSALKYPVQSNYPGCFVALYLYNKRYTYYGRD